MAKWTTFLYAVYIDLSTPFPARWNGGDALATHRRIHELFNAQLAKLDCPGALGKSCLPSTDCHSVTWWVDLLFQGKGWPHALPLLAFAICCMVDAGA